MRCRYCRMSINAVPQAARTVYVVSDGGTTTADGLSYCPPNPDHRGKFRDHVPLKADKGA